MISGVGDGKMPITMGKTGLSTVLNQDGAKIRRFPPDRV
jgi:hypothetical protein